MVTLVRHDLEFILQQIRIAEAHAAGADLSTLVDSPLFPYGLRTVDGSYNNLTEGRETWGQSGQPFPRMSEPDYRNEGDDALMFGTPANPVWLTNNDYASTGGTAPGPMTLPPGTVVDADPRLISNLVVDQSLKNPAAIAAAVRHAGEVPESQFSAAISAVQNAHLLVTVLEGLPPATPGLPVLLANAQAELAQLLEQYGIVMDGTSVRLPNVAPDEGISASFNSFFTLFGQFFDHGLDLIQKGGNGSVYIPLQPDDPLYVPGSPTNFMVLTRASQDAANVTTPWVDQNQTYTSHPSHQVFLREYAMVDGRPVATGHLLEQPGGGLARWTDVKEQAREMLGIELTDADVGRVPLIRTDPYGRFIPDPATGFAQVIIGIGADGIPNTADDLVISGTPDAPASLAMALRTPNAFLDDIAHAAAPVLAGGALQPDSDDATGYSGGYDARGGQTAYDDELLDAHYITGDGRGNENIGLTAVHHIFHSEHNRLAEHVKDLALASGDLAFLNEWLLEGHQLTAWPASAEGLQWNGERLFQAARFTTEMEYQHLVFEEFARKVQPDVDLFVVQPDVELDPAIFSEFANVVYRFGHSMLGQTVDRIYADGTQGNIDLFAAFLNPLEFGGAQHDGNGNPILDRDGNPVVVTHDQAAGAIIRGMTAQTGNEIDEFVTGVLRNQLVGIPLDLAAINIARGRDTGVPGLNATRAQFQDFTGGNTILRPYDSWADFALNLKNPESVINFIAAYGTHSTVATAETVEAKRAAAMALVFGGEGAPADRLNFLNATGAWADKGGLDDVDLWVGGLAERKMSFGGLLGSTFSFIFQLQMENLQDADRFYYLSRLQGLNLLVQMENNSLAKIAARNTDIGETGSALPADIFAAQDHVLYVDPAMQAQMTGLPDPTHDNLVLEAVSSLVQRGGNFIRYNGFDHVAIQGTAGDDTIIAGGGDDGIWGGDGDDVIETGYGVDQASGGAGDDILTSSGTDIGAVTVLKGEDGDDVFHGGTGSVLIFGGSGSDVALTGQDGNEVRAGGGGDFVLGGDGVEMLFGNEGDDWIEAGGGFDYIAGDHGELFFNSTVIGHDVLNGGSGDTDFDADSGDDIMLASEGIQKFIGMWGFDWAIYKGQQVPAEADMRIEVFTTLPLEVIRDRFSQVEAVSGWRGDDILRGDDRTLPVPPEDGETPPLVTDPTPETDFRYNELDAAGIARIAGLDQIITPGMMRMGDYWAEGANQPRMVFDAGNILLGGGGSDLIEGRGGDDVIDGDRWLNVRIAITDEGGTEIATAEGLGGVVRDGAGNLLHGGRTLDVLLLERVYAPGQLQIVREILDGDQDGDQDTAVFWDLRENYEITSRADGALVVSHLTQTGGAVDPVTGRNRESDGIDTLYNVEFLQFTDGTVATAGLVNTPATGLPLIVDPTPTNGMVTPTQGVTLSVDTSGIADANGLGALAYQWQSSSDGGATWTNIAALAGGTAATFSPNNGILGLGGQVGDVLRVVVSFTDGAGHAEVLASAPTAVVGANWNGLPLVNNTFNGTAGDDIATGSSPIIIGGNDALNGNGGADILNGNGGTDTLTGGAGDDRLDGGAGTDLASWTGAATGFAFGLNGSLLTVTDLTGAEGTDTLSTIEQLRFAGTARTLVNGTDANGTHNGGGAAEILLGHGGNDVLNGNGGADVLAGGAGTDTVQGGAGDDIILWRVGDGRDRVDGGANTDTMHLAGDGSAETFRIYARAAWLAVAGNTAAQIAAASTIIVTRNGTDAASIVAELANIEEIVINGQGGGDTFIPIGDFAPTSLSYSTITLEGGDGDDTIDITALASEHRVVFRSSGGEDRVIGSPRPQDELPGTVSAVPEQGEEHGDDDHQDDPGAEDDEEDEGEEDATSADRTRMGGATDDALAGGAGADVLLGRGGDDWLDGGAGDDMLGGGEGADDLFGGVGRDMIHGDAGDDRLFGGAGDDLIAGGAGQDIAIGGAGDDHFLAAAGDGDDIYWGDETWGGTGIDTLDLSLITADATVDLGTGAMGRGSAHSAQSGSDVLWNIENVLTGAGDDRITASTARNMIDTGAGEDVVRFLSAAHADGDSILGFEPGDRLDLSAMDGDTGAAGRQGFTLITGETFTGAGQLRLTEQVIDGESWQVLEGNVSGGTEADFRVKVKSSVLLTEDHFQL